MSFTFGELEGLLYTVGRKVGFQFRSQICVGNFDQGTFEKPMFINNVNNSLLYHLIQSRFCETRMRDTSEEVFGSAVGWTGCDSGINPSASHRSHLLQVRLIAKNFNHTLLINEIHNTMIQPLFHSANTSTSSPQTLSQCDAFFWGFQFHALLEEINHWSQISVTFYKELYSLCPNIIFYFIFFLKHLFFIFLKKKISVSRNLQLDAWNTQFRWLDIKSGKNRGILPNFIRNWITLSPRATEKNHRKTGRPDNLMVALIVLNRVNTPIAETPNPEFSRQYINSFLEDSINCYQRREKIR